MSDPAKELFEVLQRQIPGMTSNLSKALRAILGPELLRQMTPEQHRRMTEQIEIGFNDAVVNFLAPFNNVGCVLKGPVVGFSIVPKYLHGTSDTSKDLSRDGMDYVDMWRDFTAAPANPWSGKIATIVDRRVRKTSSDHDDDT